MANRPHVFRTPLLILLALAITLALVVSIGLPLWAAHEERVSAIPGSGTYTCEELSMSITFGRNTIVTLPDGTSAEVGIDHGRQMMTLYHDAPNITGWYEARLENGYIELRFTELPIPFEPDRTYRFEEG